MRNPRSFWSVAVISLVAVTLLQWLAGTPASPLERLLHVSHVPAWWPFVLAGLTGIAGGILLNRQTGDGAGPAGARSPGGGGRGPAEDPKRGRYAVPRHIRRERERERRRAQRRADAEARAREAAAAEARAAAAAAQSRPASGWLGRIGGVFGRRPQ